MEDKQTVDKAEVNELPDNWWYRVYVAVFITNVLVISALWAFSRYYS